MRLRPALLSRLSAAAALLALIAGCGDQDSPKRNPEEAKIRATVLAWYAALARADGDKACGLMTPTLREQTADDGPELDVRQDGTVKRIPRSCPARVTRISTESIVNQGIAPGINNAVVTKIDVLDDRATTRTRLGKGEQILALTKIDARWLVSGVPQG
jgi:hypothetical protein